MKVSLKHGTPDYERILKRLKKGERPADIARTECYTSSMIGAVLAHLTMRKKAQKLGVLKEQDAKNAWVRAKVVGMIYRGYDTSEIVQKLQISVRSVAAIRAHATRGHYPQGKH